MIKLDLDNTYAPVEGASDWSSMTFLSELKNDTNMMIRVEIKALKYPYLPDVFNLAFGPAGSGKIDDNALINHKNVSKVFSTIILFTLKFLRIHPDASIGLDGSNDVRAYLYHRMYLLNRLYLSRYFITSGVDWFVRLLRSGDLERDSDGSPLFKPKPEAFDYQRAPKDLYTYYLYQLKN